MGDRAVIGNRNKDIGVYLHWYGYREFVESVLAYCDAKGYRSPDVDSEYGWARLCQVLGNSIGGALSVGVGNYKNMDIDNWDNGTYIIENWNIKERLYSHIEDQQMKDSMFENLKYINDKQPEEEKLKDEELKSFAELWELKNVDRLNDERKKIVEEKLKQQATETKQEVEKVDKPNVEKDFSTKISDVKGKIMTKGEFLKMFAEDIEDTQTPTGENEVKEQQEEYKQKESGEIER